MKLKFLSKQAPQLHSLTLPNPPKEMNIYIYEYNLAQEEKQMELLCPHLEILCSQLLLDALLNQTKFGNFGQKSRNFGQGCKLNKLTFFTHNFKCKLFYMIFL